MTATLAVGDNTWYVLVKASDNTTKLYTLSIRRRPIYTVTFQTNGGTTVGAQQVEEDSFVTSPTTTKTGYNFTGWDFNFDNPIIESKTISASWQAITNTVSFDANNGTGAPTGVTATYASVMPTISTKPIRTGYVFSGFFDTTSGGIKYYNDDLTSARAWDKTANTTLYAQWTAITYTAKFYGNGGTGSMTDQSFTYGSSQNLTNNLFERIGHGFAGWTTNSDGTGTKYLDGASILNLAATNGAVIELYAQWTTDEYEVTLNKNGGTGGTSSITAMFGAAMPTATKPNQRDGYDFDGYYDAAVGGAQYYTSTMASARTWNKAQGGELFARWIAQTYTVTLDRQGATNGTTSVTVTYYQAMPSATAPSRTGYTFGGYFTEENGAGLQYYTNNMVSVRIYSNTTGITLYAKWTADTNTVSFNANNGTGAPSAVTATYDSAMPTISTKPTRTGYIFNGFFDATSGGIKYYNDDLTSARSWDKTTNITLQAQWTAIAFSVKFNANG
jgi:uncharacterized repeat protein (TIGR02543 family)